MRAAEVSETIEEGQEEEITGEQLQIDLLPAVYDIVRSVEREVTEGGASKARDSQDCSQKVLELHRKLEAARRQAELECFLQIRRLPGIQHTKKEQLRQFEILRTQLYLKKELLKKYRAMCLTEGSFK